MAWCHLEDSFRDHRKLKRLAADLGVRRAEARGLLSGLWSWALLYAVDGDLRDFNDNEIEEGADWEGERGAFVKFAYKQKLLDKKRSGYVLHNYLDRAGSYKKAVQKQKERKKKKNATVARQGGDKVATVAPVSPRDEKRRDEKRRDEQRGTEQGAGAPVLSVQEDLDPVSTISAQIQAVWSCHRKYHPGCTEHLNPKRKEYKLVKARLAEGFTVEQLCDAIDGYHKSPHHLGQNEQKTKYLGLALSMRDSGYVEAGIQYNERPTSGHSAEHEKWLNEGSGDDDPEQKE